MWLLALHGLFNSYYTFTQYAVDKQYPNPKAYLNLFDLKNWNIDVKTGKRSV